MKKIEKIPKTIKEHEEVTGTSCDICKTEIEYNEDTDININARIGNIYPECDCRDAYIIDCCEKCFLTKVKPLIEKAFKIKFRTPSPIDEHEF